MNRKSVDYSQSYRKQSGFNLVELALVLVIIGILSVGGFQMIQSQRDSAKYSSSKQSLQQVKQALLAYALVNQYLPCPDTNQDGRENRNGSRCTAATGRLPYIDLGLNKANVSDGWGNPIRYAVNQEAASGNICAQSASPPAGRAANYFCNTPTAPQTALPQFDLNTLPTQVVPSTGDYSVCDASVNNCTAASSMAADNQSVVLVAFNKDGYISNCNSLSTQERENCDTDTLYWAARFNNSSTAFFDDTIETISGYDIKKAFLENNPMALQ
ncbi:type II secretion system protein [Hydrogenovibrio sp. JE_KL2]|uniref:type II secretion system protein n=1 Tax=Hydrogenovibrio sp. JE_KL2 TaxID=2651188 RepID=UPI00128B1BBD|nr:type II secretion system protein [Hydrogenovibrio sp. JE_KL2]